MTKPRILAAYVAGTPPASVQTPEEWLIWRDEEDARMIAVVTEQIAAALEQSLAAQTRTQEVAQQQAERVIENNRITRELVEHVEAQREVTLAVVEAATATRH